jgi:phage FluMu gp28-like protein
MKHQHNNMTNNNLTNIVLPSSGQDLATRIETLVDRLFPYQQRWVKDPSRRKFGLMARQVGKDFSSGFEGLADCALAEAQGRKTDWIIAAPSERQSLESLRRWKEWCEIFHLAFVDEQVVREGGSESLLKSVTITFPHGSRVMAVPSKPETVRGFSANVLFTEFAFFEQPEQTWRAVKRKKNKYPRLNAPRRKFRDHPKRGVRRKLARLRRQGLM